LSIAARRRPALPHLREVLDRAEGKVADWAEVKDHRPAPVHYIVLPPRLLNRPGRKEYPKDLEATAPPDCKIISNDLYDDV
jgi:hypothetical protein